jgi:uncharacterized membrane protein YidH (DUF202 family)
MLHGQEKRGAQSGPALLIMAIPAILHGLSTLPVAFNANGLWVVRGIVAALFWIAAGGFAIAAQTAKSPIDRGKVAMALRVGGVVLLLFGLLSFYDVYDFLDRGIDFNVFTVVMAVRGVLWIVLAAAMFGRASATSRAPAVAPAPAPAYPQQQYSYPQQGYPQQQYPYPQQQYPQQQYPQQGMPPGGNWPQGGGQS